MPLDAGTHLGPYEIGAPIGAGGMGVVYRARDTRLSRSVAIKILPDIFVTDGNRLARFEREAKTLASLNHANIAQVYGLETIPSKAGGDLHALVMEFVDGEDLSAMIGRGPLTLADALPIARQIAEALESAHDAAIVHRDLKPANVKVRPDGTVKVLDFGLAKAVDPSVAHGSADASPTMTSPATQAGMILGTAAYMSPEQARGKAVDRRSDLWAFGCVLFEMLSGRRAFPGDEISDVLAEVIKSEPDWPALPPDTPTPIRRLLRRCLAKDPKQRIADASTARLEIDEALGTASDSSSRAAFVSGGRDLLAWTAAGGMALIAAAAIAVPYLRGGSTEGASPPEARLQIVAPGGGDPLLSPDGRQIAYPVAQARGAAPQLVVRPLDSDVAKPLPGTAPASEAFWSPDAKSIAFFSNQKLKRIDVATGAVQTLADAPTPRGGAWAPDGTILFAPAGNGPLYRIPATGGTPEAVTRLRAQDASHRAPEFLPDGRHFMFWVLGPRGVRGEYVSSLDAPEMRRLFDADGPVTFAAPTSALFIREGVLYAQRLDLVGVKAFGDPVPVATSNVSANSTGGKRVSASASGVIAYRPDVNPRRQLTWYDRTGTSIGTIGEPLPDLIGGSLSPDRRTVAVVRDTHGQPEIWLMEVARGTLTRFTSEGANRPVWSPDGTRIAFQSGQDGFGRLYWRTVGASGPDELLYRSSEAQNMNDWSPDGKFILYSSQSPTTARDLWVLPVDAGDRKPRLFAGTSAEENNGTFSADGRWIAYDSDETGRREVFVRPFPGPGRAVRVSTSGGSAPYWRRDGTELFFASAGQVMAVPMTRDATGAIAAGTPKLLFPATRGSISATDGQRFLVTRTLDDLPPPPITVIVNWRQP